MGSLKGFLVPSHPEIPGGSTGCSFLRWGGLGIRGECSVWTGAGHLCFPENALPLALSMPASSCHPGHSLQVTSSENPSLSELAIQLLFGPSLSFNSFCDISH